MKKYKKGTWLLCKWTKGWGNNIDLIKYNKSCQPLEGDMFSWSLFYRIMPNGDIQDLSNEDSKTFPFKDNRLSIQPRLLTQKELKKYSHIINKPKPKKSEIVGGVFVTKEELLDFGNSVANWELDLTDFEKSNLSYYNAMDVVVKRKVSDFLINKTK